jgi:hypothetical protein
MLVVPEIDYAFASYNSAKTIYRTFTNNKLSNGKGKVHH